MQIAIIGAGSIGATLARAWARAGHTVTIGAREPAGSRAHALAQELGAPARVASVAEAIGSGEVVLFAIPGAAMAATIAEHGPALAGKLVIDSANRVGAAPMHSAADFAAHAPGAQVYRAFNSLGWENFAQPRFGDTAADMFFCGPDGAGRAAVERLIADVGLGPVWVGGGERADMLDALTGLWFALAIGQGRGRHLALKLLADGR